MAAVPAGSEAVLCKVMLWLLRQPGERINTSAVPMAPQASFQALSSHLAYPASTNSADSVNSGTHAFLQGIFPTQGSNPRLFMSPAVAHRFFTASAT